MKLSWSMGAAEMPVRMRERASGTGRGNSWRRRRNGSIRRRDLGSWRHMLARSMCSGMSVKEGADCDTVLKGTIVNCEIALGERARRWWNYTSWISRTWFGAELCPLGLTGN